ncbi:hypothetical protein [Halorarius litoreus]|uniref:hypothetical protein n=1 Tax=Halorarius litoreus TaxID=2962676 RepID=UPI0020CFCF7C|nr:hypothetical protein [Halorarius litoreus]
MGVAAPRVVLDERGDTGHHISCHLSLDEMRERESLIQVDTSDPRSTDSDWPAISLPGSDVIICTTFADRREV